MLRVELINEYYSLQSTLDRLENRLAIAQGKRHAELEASLQTLLQRLSDVEFSLGLKSHPAD